ncbi:hypothetical protein V9T40_014766 [Parthenolecanium corni]|uniref:alpha-glucosidase n=1 Tax=Parthenolecanium corni TaxID=536013 RepID=A0AAN9XX81_9HEMI
MYVLSSDAKNILLVLVKKVKPQQNDLHGSMKISDYPQYCDWLTYTFMRLPFVSLDTDWWKHSVIYEIYTPSFKDSNGDGYGDLKGVTSKLDYLKDLGVDVIWLTPFFPSPMLDTGYDVSDYVGINHLFGTMADFDNLMKQLKRRGMKMIIDLVINHSSDQHKWFQKSIKRIKPYTDYYVWKDPKGYNETGHPIPPNNWLSFFETSAWEWNEKRRQFYYHVFLPQQPDLNLWNRRVKNEMIKIIKFWSDKGVAGIRLDATNWLLEGPSYDDEHPIDESKKGQTVSYFQINHTNIINTEGTFEYICELRESVDKISRRAKNYERIIIPEAWGRLKTYQRLYGNETRQGVHFPFNFLFLMSPDYMNSTGLNQLIDDWINITPKRSAPNWVIESHDKPRTSSILTREYVHIWLTLISLLPGITVLYYGQEIEMQAGIVRPHQLRIGSEYSRSPMQWDESSNAGFSTNQKTWIPINPNYWRLNLKQQQNNPNSTYNFLKDLLKLKKTETIKYGDFKKYIFSDWLFAFTRSYDPFEDYIVVINLGTEKETISLQSRIVDLPSNLTVCLASRNSKINK